MGGNNDAVVGMRLHNVARPGKLRVGGAVVKGDVKIFHVACRKGGVGGFQLIFAAEALEHTPIGIGAEDGVELGRGIVVAANERVGNNAVKLSNLGLGNFPFRVGVLVGDVAKTKDVGDLLFILVGNDKIVDTAELVGLVYGDLLCVAHDAEGVGVIGDGLFVGKPGADAEHVVHSVAVIDDGIVHDGGGEVIVRQQMGVGVFDPYHVRLDLLCGAHVGEEGDRADGVLEILRVARAVVTRESKSGAEYRGFHSGRACLCGTKGAVDIAIHLVALGIVDDGYVRPVTRTHVSAREDVIVYRFCAVHHVKTGSSVCGDLKIYAGHAALVVADDGALTCAVARGHVDPSLKGERDGFVGTGYGAKLVLGEGETAGWGRRDGNHHREEQEKREHKPYKTVHRHTCLIKILHLYYRKPFFECQDSHNPSKIFVQFSQIDRVKFVTLYAKRENVKRTADFR